MKKQYIIFIILYLFSLVSQAQISITEEKGEYLIAISRDLLGKEILFGSRVVELTKPKGKVYAAGQVRTEPSLITFEEFEGRAILLNHLDDFKVVRKKDRIKKVVEDNSVQATSQRFKIVREEDSLIYFDVTDFFTIQTPIAWPLPANERLGSIAHSEIIYTRTYEDHINIRTQYRYKGGKIPFNITVQYFMMLAPEDITPRGDDKRIGIHSVGRSEYSSGEAIETKKNITRWRLAEDSKIIFYVDPAFPEGWYPYIKEGIEAWNMAFEKIGYSDVIEVRNYPKSEDFDPYDVKINTLRYLPIKDSNAAGFTHLNPKTGEIVFADILWWNDVVNRLKDWRFIQTSVSDPNARLFEYNEEMMGEMIRYVVAHEMGHVLGFKHNMVASAAYPTDSLKSTTFTQKYGTTASIMDYARFNHIASFEDVKRGVNLMPPLLGPFDYLSVEYAYGDYDDKETMFEKYSGDEMYSYAPYESTPVPTNPKAQSESLGDDVLKSSQRGRENCIVMLDSLNEWTYDNGGTEDDFVHRYRLIEKAYFRYLTLAMSNIGGKVEIHQPITKDKYRYVPVDKELQNRTLEFVVEAMRDADAYFFEDKLTRGMDYDYEGFFKMQSKMVEHLVNTIPQRVLKNQLIGCGDGYTLEEYFKSLDQLMKKRKKGDIFDEYIYQTYISMIKVRLSEKTEVTPYNSIINRTIKSQIRL